MYVCPACRASPGPSGSGWLAAPDGPCRTCAACRADSCQSPPRHAGPIVRLGTLRHPAGTGSVWPELCSLSPLHALGWGHGGPRPSGKKIGRPDQTRCRRCPRPDSATRGMRSALSGPEGSPLLLVASQLRTGTFVRTAKTSGSPKRAEAWLHPRGEGAPASSMVRPFVGQAGPQGCGPPRDCLGVPAGSSVSLCGCMCVTKCRTYVRLVLACNFVVATGVTAVYDRAARLAGQQLRMRRSASPRRPSRRRRLLPELAAIPGHYAILPGVSRRRTVGHARLLVTEPRWWDPPMLRRRVTELHYITPIANLSSIAAWGILSHNLAARLPHTSVSLESVQDRRSRRRVPQGRPLHDYANLYFDAVTL